MLQLYIYDTVSSTFFSVRSFKSKDIFIWECIQENTTAVIQCSFIFQWTNWVVSPAAECRIYSHRKKSLEKVTGNEVTGDKIGVKRGKRHFKSTE